MSAVRGRLSPVIDSEVEETDDTAAGHASQAMGESASVEVLSGEAARSKLATVRSPSLCTGNSTKQHSPAIRPGEGQRAQTHSERSAAAGGPRHGDRCAGSLRRLRAQLDGLRWAGGVHALADASTRDTAWLRPKNIRSQSLTNLTFFGGKVSATASAMLRSTGTSARNSEVGTPIGQATSG
jgi:hypothetical protein